MKKGSKYILILFIITVSSCNFLEKSVKQKAIARVHENYLYEADFLKVLPVGLSKKDSFSFAQQYINHWVTQQILMQKASLNLTETTQHKFDKLAEEYKEDLYTNAYLDALISKKIDTLITEQELSNLYEKTKINFKLNETLLKFRFIGVDNKNSNINDLSERLKRFNKEDKKVLDSLTIQFQSYMLNDSIWMKKSQMLQKIPILNSDENLKLLKKSNFLQLKDSLRVYLVFVNNLLARNEQAPQQYVSSTLRQIILNKRKLKQIKQLKIELRNNAKQNKEFEIYN